MVFLPQRTKRSVMAGFFVLGDICAFFLLKLKQVGPLKSVSSCKIYQLFFCDFLLRQNSQSKLTPPYKKFIDEVIDL